MKYLYKAMENIGDASGNVVLGWHEKVRSRWERGGGVAQLTLWWEQLVEQAGTGCIVRVMTDRRRV